MNDKRVIRAWTFYDWANSAYNLIVTSAIFPAYFTAVVPATVLVGTTEIANESIASWSISLAFLIIAFLSPILGAIADTKGNKKSFMRFFCTLGALACMALFFFKKNELGETNIWYGVICSVIACIGFCGSIVFYNAYLPEIASKDKQDAVSAKGFIMGYVGSVILLVLSLAFILLNKTQHWMDGSLPPRISFVAVGIWWLGWSMIPFSILKDNPGKESNSTDSLNKQGLKKLSIVWNEMKRYPLIKKYLSAYFFINMGVQTIMYMATYFAAKEIKLAQDALIKVVLIIQLVAIAGAWLFAKISNRYGNIVSLSIMTVLWIGICFSACYLVYTTNHFYVLAFAVGLIMGGTQSMSRSTFSKMIPVAEEEKQFDFENSSNANELNENKTASYFSFLDIVDKFSIVLGTSTFGLISNALGMRMSALALGIYFIIGLILLQRVKTKS
jgi:MFS transporter, UMF1 family